MNATDAALRYPMIDLREYRMHVSLDTTGSCNIRCSHCWMESVRQEGYALRPYTMPFDLFQHIIGQIQPYTDRLTLSCVAAQPTAIKFSLEGATASTHEAVRHGATFERFTAALEALVRARREYGTGRPAIHFNWCIMQHNLSDADALAELAAKCCAERSSSCLTSATRGPLVQEVRLESTLPRRVEDISHINPSVQTQKSASAAYSGSNTRPPQLPAVSFSPIMPATIRPMHRNRGAVAGSLKRIMPKAAVPTAPTPVQIAYPVPIGIVRTAIVRQYMLTAIAATVPTDGHRRVHPSVYFMLTAQIISMKPAMPR